MLINEYHSSMVILTYFYDAAKRSDTERTAKKNYNRTLGVLKKYEMR